MFCNLGNDVEQAFSSYFDKMNDSFDTLEDFDIKITRVDRMADTGADPLMSSAAFSSYFDKMNDDFDALEDFDINITCADRMADTGADPFGEISFNEIFDLIKWNEDSGDNSKGHNLGDSQAFVENFNTKGNKIISPGPCFKSTSTPFSISQKLQHTGDMIELGTNISLHKLLINRRRRRD